MSLTKKSEKLIKHFIDDFDKYCVKNSRCSKKYRYSFYASLFEI